MEQSLWRTLGHIDFLHPLHKWLQTIVMWETLHQNAGLLQDADFASDLTDFESTSGGVFVHRGKPHIRDG